MSQPQFAVTDEEGGLVFATLLPGRAEDFGDRRLGWSDLAESDDGHPLWCHLDRMRPRAQTWIREEAGLEPMVADALLAAETRPSFQEYGNGLLVILRGVNLNPGAEPDELIALRMWIGPRRLITLRQHRFQTIADIRALAEKGKAPATPGAFLASVAYGLALRVGPCVSNLESLLDDVEGALVDESAEMAGTRAALASVRRQAISIRRHMVPQRDALRALTAMRTDLFATQDVALLGRATEEVARSADALEEVRDRAAVTQDEVRARHEARIGRTVYLLTLVATVALPLGLLTGLLGINVGGIPLAESAWGFAIVCFGLVAVAVIEVAVLRWLRWF